MIVYYFRNPDSVSEECINGILPNLPQQQQQIVANIKNHRHRCEQVVAYIMLCNALKTQDKWISDHTFHIKNLTTKQLTTRYVRRNPPIWSFGKHGKPYMTNYEGIYFNISHCNEAVAVAVSDHEVGIDVEGRRKFSDGLLQRAFNDEEQAIIHSSDDNQKEFACLWTRKEAWFKYTGTGILLDHLKSTEADARNAGCNIVTFPVVPTEEGDKVFWLSIAEDGQIII